MGAILGVLLVAHVIDVIAELLPGFEGNFWVTFIMEKIICKIFSHMFVSARNWSYAWSLARVGLSCDDFALSHF